MKPHAKTALSLALAIVGGIAAGMRCDASVTEETPTQYTPRPAAYIVKAYTEGSDPFDAREVAHAVAVNAFALPVFLTLLAAFILPRKQEN